MQNKSKKLRTKLFTYKVDSRKLTKKALYFIACMQVSSKDIAR